MKKETTKMDYETYRDFVVTRLARKDTLLEDLIHMTLGLSSEIIEIMDSKSTSDMIEELGDMMFYATGLDHLMDHNFDHASTLDDQKQIYDSYLFDATFYIYKYQVSKLSDAIKRSFIYGDELPDLRYTNQSILKSVTTMCLSLNMSPEEMMDINIKKLSKRYPNGFSKDDALNRDVEAEKKTMRSDD